MRTEIYRVLFEEELFVIVTKITEISKARSKVYIDYEFAFVLYKGELRLYHIKEEQEIAEEDYEELMNKVLPKRAKLRSMNLLKNKEYTENQLRNKLRLGFYHEKIIEEAIAYVKSYHYIDDVRYTAQFIEYNMGMKSKKRMEMDLLKKGIDRELINSTFEELQEEDIQENELVMIKKLVEKKHFDARIATNQEKMRLYAFLYRKGFSSENIKKVIQTAEHYD